MTTTAARSFLYFTMHGNLIDQYDLCVQKGRCFSSAASERERLAVAGSRADENG